MQTIFRPFMAIATAAILAASTAARAEWTGNLGFASDYYYRGVFQAGSSASAGIDYDNRGFFSGIWAADVGQGLEVDTYLGYAGAIGKLDYKVGYTGYFYTDDFDDTYQEINLGFGYGFMTFDIAAGEYANFNDPRQDYEYYALGLEKNGFYGKYATFTRDFSGEFLEVGYTTNVSDFDIGISLIVNSEELDVVNNSGSESIIFTIGKSFGF